MKIVYLIFRKNTMEVKQRSRDFVNVLSYVSECIIPIILLYIVGFGIISKRPVFEDFLEGAKDGVKIVIELIPTLIGLIVSVGVLRYSGFFHVIGRILAYPAKLLGIPETVVPVMLIRIISNSAATGFVLDIFHTYGPDSLEGNMVSILMGCTETLLYTMSVYFMKVKVKKTRWTFPGGLFATAAGITASIYLAKCMILN